MSLLGSSHAPVAQEPMPFFGRVNFGEHFSKQLKPCNGRWSILVMGLILERLVDMSRQGDLIMDLWEDIHFSAFHRIYRC